MILWVTIVVIHFWLWWRYIKLKEAKEHEHYTDYIHGDLILRIYKPEFEYIVKLDVQGMIVDEGIFSPVYNWILIKKKK